MNAQVKIDTDTTEPVTGLALLRRPFEPRHISKLPKPTAAQTKEVKDDFKKGIRCNLCGSWHHPQVVHLDYVGHAALTDRLLDVDPEWSWEPAALRDGLPAFDQTGGLWIKLTVCGVTRLGYGHAAAKPNQDPGAREKEVIGDALRNAAMRFGAALDLWHKGDLHGEPDEAADTPSARDEPKSPATTLERRIRQSAAVTAATSAILELRSRQEMEAWVDANEEGMKSYPKADLDAIQAAYNARWKNVPAKIEPETETFRRGGSGGMAGNNRPAPQAHDLIPEDEIPY